ncbi:hypothetical protein CPLU01_02624 [Colletotrichum plurivorum]|uniref:Uncharacterized protein n=1 Tax=Colletotrichum plurivorum TaxID=2175906 RepID=A0A8H6NMH9_9PEZI|nr:hypothetical protein CPLU01_02624 [Colletotrichum plurivorum]
MSQQQSSRLLSQFSMWHISSGIGACHCPCAQRHISKGLWATVLLTRDLHETRGRHMLTSRKQRREETSTRQESRRSQLVVTRDSLTLPYAYLEAPI